MKIFTCKCGELNSRNAGDVCEICNTETHSFDEWGTNIGMVHDGKGGFYGCGGTIVGIDTASESLQPVPYAVKLDKDGNIESVGINSEIQNGMGCIKMIGDEDGDDRFENPYSLEPIMHMTNLMKNKLNEVNDGVLVVDPSKVEHKGTFYSGVRIVPSPLTDTVIDVELPTNHSEIKVNLPFDIKFDHIVELEVIIYASTDGTFIDPCYLKNLKPSTEGPEFKDTSVDRLSHYAVNIKAVMPNEREIKFYLTEIEQGHMIRGDVQLPNLKSAALKRVRKIYRDFNEGYELAMKVRIRHL